MLYTTSNLRFVHEGLLINMNSRKTTFTELIVKALFLFAIFTVIQSIEIFDGINRIWMIVLGGSLAGRMVQFSYTPKQIIMLIILGFLHIIAIYYTDFPLVNANMLFYFLLWVLLYLFFAKNKTKITEIMQNSERYIHAVLLIWTAIVGVSAFIPSCYRNNYFDSFAGSSFRLMPTVLIVTALAMYLAVAKKNKKYNLFLILPIYAGFMNSSRTYFGVFLLFMIMYIYMQMKSKRLFWKMVVPGGILVLILMGVTGISDKFTSSMYTETSYFDFWGTITSGRTIFWETDMKAFFGLPIWQQFVGNGFNFVYDVNEASFAQIWAHNDFINILMNFGYLGLIIYFWSFNEMIRTCWPKGNPVPFFVKSLFLTAVFLNSMFNMSYTYLCAMISYPLFLCVIDRKYDMKNYSLST